MEVWTYIKKIWNTPEIRRSIFFILAMMIVVRIAAHIPIPGIDAQGLSQFFQSNQFLGLLNVFSGGALSNFSIVMLGLGPYITASIIFQLLGMIVPKLEEIQKEGESGQKRINQWTRLLTVPLALLQGYATITLLQQSTQGFSLVPQLDVWHWVVALASVTAGSLFMMWLGELITERNLGNGVSLLIFAGIIAGLPTSIQQFVATYDSSQLPVILGVLAVSVITIAGVVFVTEAQRKIPVSYARQMRAGGATGGVKSHLPLRVNQAGVIPIIFAVSFVIFPPLIAQFLQGYNISWLNPSLNFIIVWFNNNWVYGIIYFVLVVVFTYFYTAVIFKPDQVAENLQKNGAFVPGIRPGKPTADYLQFVSTRILLAGALFLGAIAVLPLAVQGALGGSFQSLAIGGTSLLIVVSVALETVKQIEAQLSVRDYDNL